MKKIQLWKGNEEPETEKMTRKAKLFAILASVAASIILWFVVQGVQSPDYTDVVSSVKLIPREKPAELSIYSVSPETCKVNLVGKRSDVNRIRSDDLAASFDLSEVTEAGEYDLPITVSGPSGIVCSAEPQTVHVRLDEEKSADVPVELVLGEYQTEGEGVDLRANLVSRTVSITGPAGSVTKVAKAVLFTGDQLGLITAEKKLNLPYELRDEEGQVISDPYIVFEKSAYQLVTFYPEKTRTVPVEVETENGFFAPEDLAVSPSTVIVKGDPSTIDRLTGIVIVKLNESGYEKLPVQVIVPSASVSLPQGVSLASDQGDFTVTVNPKNNVARTLSVNMKSSRVTLLAPDGMDAVLAEDLVNFTVRGPASAVDRAALSDFRFVIDLRYAEDEGEQKALLQIVPVKEDLAYYAAGEYTVTATLTKKS